MFRVCFSHLILLASNLLAVEQVIDHGVMGELFPINEKNLIDVIMHKLNKLQADGKLEAYNQQIQAKVKSGIERPNPVKDIVHTKAPRSYTFDPTITVSKDLADHNGKVFHHKGDKVNPLHYRQMTKPFLLIDGDDADHLTWALRMLKKHPLGKIILVKGAPLQIWRELGITIYFDQFGKITEKFGIKQVPALVTQSDDALLIQEMKADDLWVE